MIGKVFYNDKILGKYELDFTDGKGNCYNNIVLIGENGSGKTKSLSFLNDFINFGSFEPFEKIEYYNSKKELIIAEDAKMKIMEDSYSRTKNGKKDDVISSKKSDDDDIRNHHCIMVKAITGFTTDEVINIKSSELDKGNLDNLNKSNDNDYTYLKQLLIDIHNSDSVDYANWSEKNPDKTLEVYLKNHTRRIDRFKKAFNNFFEELRFDEISNYEGKYNIKFVKNGKEIMLEELSTGEKAIVFKGAYILSEINFLENGIVIVDEPELSMHPKWQEKLYTFFKNILYVNGIQKIQLIIATHSEFIINEAISDGALLIGLKNERGNILASRFDNSFETLATINYKVFGIISIDLHIQLYGKLQIEYQEESIVKTDQLICKEKCYIAKIHEKPSTYKNRKYNSISTYIRNAIDHPDNGNKYTKEELIVSVELMISILKDHGIFI